MELLTLAIGGAMGFGIGAIERFRLHRRIRTLLTSLPDSKDVSLSLASLVRREITHLQDRCEAYQNEVDYWQGVMDLSPLGYLLIDGDNHLEWCNGAAQSLLQIRGWQTGERRLFLEFIRSYELDQLIERTRQSQSPQAQEWSFFPPLKATINVKNPLVPESIFLKGYGYPLATGRVAIFVENQQMLAELRQGRDQAFSDLAHELRTPLTAIALIAERLQSRLAPGDQSWIERQLKEVNRLQNLVESWLYLTQITANPNLYLESEPIDLRHLLKITWERLLPIAAQKNIQLAYQGPEKLPLTGDGDRLMQVLMNLLDNALKHSPQDSTIHVQGGQDVHHICLTIWDQGQGFNPKDLPYIFERLYRGDSSRARIDGDRQRQGSGLGLAIAKEIITAHSGSLSAQNDPDHGGALFQLELPTGDRLQSAAIDG
ncbi:MAG: phosphate regulon regulator SphS/Hik07 [Cyanobacteriota bacterium]|jgi:two-component system phosphate regulon sensor histidine kinase PhoR